MYQQYLVRIEENDKGTPISFYKLVDDDEALDNLFDVYGPRIVSVWRLGPPTNGTPGMEPITWKR